MWIWSKLVLSSKTFYSPWILNNVLKSRGKGHSYQCTTFRFKTLLARSNGQARSNGLARAAVCGELHCDLYFCLKPSASKLANNAYYQTNIFTTVRYFGTRKYKYASHSSSFLIRRKEALILILLGITGGVVYGWNKKVESDKFDRKMHEINEIIKKAQTLDIDGNQSEMRIKLLKQALEQVKIEIDSEQSSQSRMSALTTKFVFIIDQLANLMHGVNKLDEAVEYYKQTLRALISHGTSREDDAVIEISLKLASIYAKQGRHELAETGFSWCVETARKKVNETEKLNANSSALLGICLESYGTYLLSRNNACKAITLFSEALVIARKVFGDKHEQVALLLNNLGVAYVETGHMELSKTFFNEAINLSTEEKYDDLWSFHLNLGNVLRQTGDIEEARREYNQALDHCRSETVKHSITDQLLKLS